ncbi:ATP-binding protein [Mesorhizobium sp. CN5-321]|uniref:ATP-binding protein n=1 Tax=Mesorhizobium hunchu TaxID=3157708 RepID=UPI0032B7CCFC
MADQIVALPGTLSASTVIDFANRLSIRDGSRCIFDFTNVTWCEPFGLLYLGRVLRTIKSRHPELTLVARTVENDFRGYASHLGFFRYAGFPRGNRPGEASGSGTYVAIQRWRVSEIQEEAGYNPYGSLVDNKAHEICSIMLQAEKGPAFEYTQYALRELLRNAIEHSDGDEVLFLAQYWPRKGASEIAIIDDGIGLRRSLGRNSKLSVTNDVSALQLAMAPGISRVTKRSSRDGEWRNSGFGLYMTSNLCASNGEFRLVSGKAGIRLQAGKRSRFEARFKGTGVQMTLAIPKNKSLNDFLQELRLKARTLVRQGGLVSEPSASSLTASKRGKHL